MLSVPCWSCSPVTTILERESPRFIITLPPQSFRSLELSHLVDSVQKQYIYKWRVWELSTLFCAVKKSGYDALCLSIQERLIVTILGYEKLK